MKKVFQYRYYYDDANTSTSPNMPKTLTMKELANGSAFAGTKPIYQLGIQTLPGTKVYINSPYEGSPIIINKSGIFEIEVDNQSLIISLRVDKESAKHISDINTQGRVTPITNAYLIIDVIYDDSSTN